MIPIVLTVLAILALVGALLSVPIGLPGVWIMLGVLLIAVIAGAVPWLPWLGLVGITGIAEVGEFFILKRYGERYGGSKKAFWGAIIGGFVGVIVGIPVPIIGSVLAALLGTFIGAAVVTVVEGNGVGKATKVGGGVMLARVLATGLKLGVGMIVLVVGGAYLVFG